MTWEAGRTTEEPAASSRRRRLMVFDGVGLAFSVFALIWTAVAIFAVQPAFEKMLSDFGSELHAFTRLCLNRGFVLALGLVPLLLVAEGIFLNAGERGRAVRMAVAVFLTLMAPAIIMSGSYLPILQMTSAAIK